MKRLILNYLAIVAIIIMATMTTSCVKDDDKSSLPKILDGYGVNKIAFDSKGNAWIIAWKLKTNSETKYYIIRYNAQETVIYHSENSILPEDFWIMDIAVDKNDNVWIGGSGGLLKYNGKEFTFYNTQNTAMPEDIAWSIAVDSKNNIWMASCRVRQGGLVKYDGTEWTVYTPDNSDLPVNMIHSIAVDQSDNVWLALGEYVTQGSLVKISDDHWNVYTEKELGFQPYWWGRIQSDSKNRLWGSISYLFSSYSGPHFPHFIIFDGKETTLLSYDDLPKISMDNTDYVWYFGGLWIGNQWTKLDPSEFGGLSVRVVKEAPDGRIWFGAEDGIYIR